MASRSERDELHKTIWAIANKLRGKVDGWDFKAYVLGTIFYRYISENLTAYINEMQKDAGIDDFDYAAYPDEDAEEAKEQLVAEKGFFILPSQLFCNVAASADKDVNLNETLSSAFRAIEASAAGTGAEKNMKNLFSDFIVDSSKLGASVGDRNKVLADVIDAVKDMKLSQNIQDNKNDTFGDTYEFLMSMYAANAGKSGGEFFTPQEVSEILVRLATHNNDKIDSVYDPACGSGSLLMKFQKIIGKDNPNLKYYGQEINPTTHNLCRINMFLHNVNYNNFDIALGDTLINPAHRDMEFDAIVSNPPYSLKWVGKDSPILINDERYAPAGVLAPKSAADLAFTMHMLYHLKENGICAIVEFPGVLYRGGAERQIREYLIQNNYVDTVIQLPANLFFGVCIATCIIVLSKGKKPDGNVLFIDASNEYVKNGNKNLLEQQNIDTIVNAFVARKDKQYFCKLVSNEDILNNDCNLSVSSYVEQEDTREKIDIEAVNKDIVKVVKRIRGLQIIIDEFTEKNAI
ncbi:MAG: type I restriction-modification system subunit M [Prevotella sp.]|nr:type I restriction-modification system subunit M [Prevotella sp.]